MFTNPAGCRVILPQCLLLEWSQNCFENGVSLDKAWPQTSSFTQCRVTQGKAQPFLSISDWHFLLASRHAWLAPWRPGREHHPYVHDHYAGSTFTCVVSVHMRSVTPFKRQNPACFLFLLLFLLPHPPHKATHSMFPFSLPSLHPCPIKTLYMSSGICTLSLLSPFLNYNIDAMQVVRSPDSVRCSGTLKPPTASLFEQKDHWLLHPIQP